MRVSSSLWTFSLAGCLGCVVVAGCGDDGESSSGGGSGSGSGSSSSSSGSSGSPSSTATGANGVECDGALCDPATQFCGFAAGTCAGPRTCQAYPACGPDAVVCGCDGNNYAALCAALEEAGGATGSACAPPEGQFECTYEYQIPIYCDLGTEYCKVTPTGDLYDLECLPLPAACDDAPEDCSCTDDLCAENFCGIDDTNGSITVLCPLEG